MNKTREYMKTICKSLKDWGDWAENGEKYTEEGKDLLSDIGARNNELGALDAELVKDEILEHQDSIGLRLERLDNEFKFLAACLYFKDLLGKKPALSDEFINTRLSNQLRLIEKKLEDIARVYYDCEKYIKPKNPIVEAALNDRLLLSYFNGNRKELQEYVIYCINAKNDRQRALEAGRRCNKGKMRYEHLNTDLHRKMKELKLIKTGIDNWKQATLAGYKESRI